MIIHVGKACVYVSLKGDINVLRENTSYQKRNLDYISFTDVVMFCDMMCHIKLQY